MYKEHYQEFDDIGQQWIDGVRKCLQVKLVPILRPFVTVTCENIKQMAFDSHPDCYRHPDSGAPSICDIGVANWMRVFWTVKGALIQDLTATLQQMLDVGMECGPDILSTGVSKIQMTFRQMKEAVLNNLNEFAENISDQMARKLDWHRKGIIYFGYPVLIKNNRKKRATDTNSDLVHVNLLIAPGSEFDLNIVDGTPDVNVSAEAINAAEAIENGDVRLDIGDEAQFTEFSLCMNYNCTETSLQVEPAPPEKKDDSGLSATTLIIIVIAATFGLVLVVSGAAIFRKMRDC